MRSYIMSEQLPYPDHEPLGPEQQPQQRLFLEVGVGANMGYGWLTNPFQEGDKYLGIDSGLAHRERFNLSGDTFLYAGFVNARKPNAAEQFFLRADGRKLPLPDESVDEVLFTNVLSDPLLAPLVPVEDYDRDMDVTFIHTPTGERLEIAEGIGRVQDPHFVIDELGEAREALLQEANRVTKRGGRIVVHSYATPLVVNHEALVQWFQDREFDVALLHASDPGWSEAAQYYYDWDPALTLYDQRLLIAVKD